MKLMPNYILKSKAGFNAKNLFLIMILFGSFIVPHTLIQSINKGEIDKPFQSLSHYTSQLRSSYIYLTVNSILIDDLDPLHNWSKIEQDYDWCSGLGTIDNPYIIENIFIDANNSEYGLMIRNSEKHFIIRNSSFTNSGDQEYDAGLNLQNVINGTITNNNILSNKNAGCYLSQCNFVLISSNNLSYNEFGIRIYESSNNMIINNQMTHNRYGVRISRNIIEDCIFNEIIQNTIDYCDIGIYFDFLTKNTICNNSFNNCYQIGVYLAHGSNNINVTNNQFSNINNALYIGSPHNFISSNIIQKCDYAIYLDGLDSDRNEISNNIVSESNYGIAVGYCNFNYIHHNVVKNCTFGIHLELCYDGLITDNKLFGNLICIKIIGGERNIITNNDCDDIFEENDDFHHASTLNEGSYYNLTGKDKDWFKIHLNQGITIKIIIKSTEILNGTVILYDSIGTALIQTDIESQSEELTYVVDFNSFYYILIDINTTILYNITIELLSSPDSPSISGFYSVISISIISIVIIVIIYKKRLKKLD